MEKAFKKSMVEKDRTCATAKHQDKRAAHPPTGRVLPLPLVKVNASSRPYQQALRGDDRRQQHTSATVGQNLGGNDLNKVFSL